ncbi:hypothetical protein ES708_09300 [subsurface metagenome]
MKIEIQRASNLLDEKTSPNKCVVQNLREPSSKVTEPSITVMAISWRTRSDKKRSTQLTQLELAWASKGESERDF